MNFLTKVLLIFLIFVSGCNSKKKENLPLFLNGKWAVDPERSKQASVASSESETVDWEEYKNAIQGKTLYFKNGHMTCNQINSGNPIEIELKEAANFAFIFEQTKSGVPIAIKRISDEFIRVDWSINMVEVYKKINHE
jgi:hypothetical protein